ncbi:SDR family oxidoreductase [Planomonospora corallina]|uniref:SDR family oxidoreductase n=1 Tax=Planomonospora corallina TaxID=1806052 RepID=A0ABV8IGW0_9ACTN
MSSVPPAGGPAVSCVFVCHDGEGRILLARRAAGARDEPGAWDCGAGALEYGEAFEAAVAREVREEYSAAVLELEQIGVRNVVRPDASSHWVAVVFAVRVDPAEVAIGEPHKFDELGWFTPDAPPEPRHSQLAETLALFRSWRAARPAGPERRPDRRPVALVTGAGRRAGIAAAVVRRLAGTGWDVAFTFWSPYDARMPWGEDAESARALCGQVERAGGRALAVPADLADPEAAGPLFERVVRELGAVTALVMCHCESVDSGILDTTVESFDRHFAVNARAVWLLVREYGRRHAVPHGAGRIVALTSDHTAFNLPYGASKGALDRITLAAAREFAHLGVTANVVNPGPVDTGWMDDGLKREVVRATPLGRLGTPDDCANLVAFLCSPEGGWINGRLLHGDGGFGA